MKRLDADYLRVNRDYLEAWTLYAQWRQRLEDEELDPQTCGYPYDPVVDPPPTIAQVEAFVREAMDSAWYSYQRAVRAVMYYQARRGWDLADQAYYQLRAVRELGYWRADDAAARRAEGDHERS
jgi:hypothetical protein